MLGLKLNEFYEILGILKNCPAYQNNKNFQDFVKELENSHWNYIDKKYEKGDEDIDLSIFKPIVLIVKLDDLDMPKI